MSELTFKLKNNKLYILRGSSEKELPKTVLVDVYHVVLSYLAENRDYSSITSLRKLGYVLDMECIEDKSDNEEEESDEEAEENSEAEAEQATPAEAPVQTAPATTVRRGRQRVQKAVAEE